MTNADNFDADAEPTGDDEFGDAPAEEAAAAPAAAPKKSGGGIGKILLLLIVLGAGGAAGAVKMGLLPLPFEIPGLTPPSSVAAAPEAAAPAAKPAVEVAQNGNAVQPVSGAEAAPPPQPMNNIAPRSGDAPAAPPPGGDPMLPSALPAAAETSAAAPGIAPPPGATNAAAAPATAPTPAAPALAPAPELSAAPALTPPPAIAAPDASPSPPPAITAPAAAPPPPEMAAPPVEAAAPPAVGNPDEAAKLQKLDDRITALEQGIASINEMKGSVATKADLDALKAALQQEMSEHQKNPAAVQAAGREVTGYRHGKAPKVVKSPAAEMAGAKPRTRARSHKGAAVMMTTPGTSWILKSAKPGTAWVAEPGSAEIRSISVGETLSGLGKITSISQDSGGRWVVSGTKGRINQ